MTDGEVVGAAGCELTSPLCIPCASTGASSTKKPISISVTATVTGENRPMTSIYNTR
jgi:hypothetical protein